MKFSAIVLALASTAAAVTLEARQTKSNLQSAGPPLMRKDAQRKFFKFGPYKLKVVGGGGGAGKGKGGGMGGMGGMGGEGDAQSFMLSTTGASFCSSCTVLSGQIQIRYTDGTPANVSNGIYVHHILTNGMRSQPAFVKSCMGGGGGPGFVGAGDDNGNTPFLYAPKDGSLESGYWISPQDRFFGQIVLVNYNKEPKTVEVWYDLEYLPGHVGRSIKSSLISASCAGIKTSKTSAVNTTSQAMAFTEDGNIILAKGHLHDGGVAMHMKITRKSGGVFSCSSRATYGGQIATGGGHGHGETISDMTNCNDKPVKISAGDSMVMTSEYDLKAHPLRETGHGGEAGVMGMFRIIFAPEKPWGT